MKEHVVKIRKYWEDKAKEYKSKPQATTSDFWLRQIEINALEKEINNDSSIKRVLDIGCGNGYSTMELAKRCKNCIFIGFDYSSNMIKEANDSLESLPDKVKKRITFFVDDVLDIKNKYEDIDLVMSDRCLINLPTEELQEKAIMNISNLLDEGKKYIFIENFIEGHKNFNRLRLHLGLKEIPVRWHNKFFTEENFERMVKKTFKISKLLPISSLYYLATRVVYSKICELEGRVPDYDNIIYKVGAKLPFEGDYGPVKLAVLKKMR